jgi:hypothetical protein
MGARCAENAVEIIDDIHIFYRRVGLIKYSGRLIPLGLTTDNIGAMFRCSQIDELLEFCSENPAYHIVSGTSPGMCTNRYVEGCTIYMLAKGDKNPNLVLNPYIKKGHELFMEEMHEKVLAIIADMDRREKLEADLLLLKKSS